MEEVKTCIRSLLTSSPVAVRIFQLEKDYRNTIGTPIPYQKFGYNSLEHFLRSIPDTLQVRGSGPQAELVIVVTDKTAHINELISKQRVNLKTKQGYALPRRFIKQEPAKKIHYPTPKPAPKQTPNVSSIKTEPDKIPSLMSIPIKEPTINNVQSPSNVPSTLKRQLSNVKSPAQRIIDNQRSNTPNESKFEKKALETSQYKTPPKLNNDVDKFEVDKLNVSNGSTSHTKLLKEKKTNVNPQQSMRYQNNGERGDRFKFKFGETKKGVSSPGVVTHIFDVSTNSYAPCVPQYVQNNLKQLIGRHPEGVWCADLPSIYKRMFRAELLYQDYGYRSLIEMCTALTSIFHYARPSNEDFILYDRSKALPENAEKKFTIASYSGDEDGDSSNVLPSIDWEDVSKFLPQDIVQPGTDLSRVFFPEYAQEGDNFPVVVGEIYDLSKFWIYFDDNVLENLMNDLQDFYKCHHKEYIMPEHLVREGIYCVQVIFGEYHRATIVDLLPEIEGMVRLLYIDYGTVAKAPIKGLCFLHKKFAELPAQAIRCRLANVVPTYEASPWPKESIKRFREMVLNRNLDASIASINWEASHADIFLVDVTNADNVFYLNDRLVEEGYAQHSFKVNQKHTISDSPKSILKRILDKMPKK